MLRVKGSDTLAPVGPGLVTDWDFRARDAAHAGQRGGQAGGVDRRDGWDMHYLVADIARTITLSPGDLLYSGTPANSRPVQPGDVVEVEVEGLGRLTNHIVTGPTPSRTDVGAQPTESREVVSTALGGDWEFRGIRTPAGPLPVHGRGAGGGAWSRPSPRTPPTGAASRRRSPSPPDARRRGGRGTAPAPADRLPATVGPWSRWPPASDADVDRAVAAARAAFDDGPWRA